MAIQAYAPTSNTEEVEVEWFYEDLRDLLELTPPKDILFNIRDWNAKVGSQEIPGVTGKFGLGVWNEAGQRLIVLPREHTGVQPQRVQEYLRDEWCQRRRRRTHTEGCVGEVAFFFFFFKFLGQLSFYRMRVTSP